ncbi:MAG: ATP-binding protein, partial [Pseudomonadales bacterium]|nr:ATP-binding protein [Pseudomonadales bacterium]
MRTRRLTLCLTGPESTGKTTLARSLAAHFNVPMVAEAARDYLGARQGYGEKDLLEIARLQIAAERDARSSHDGLLISDTDLLVLQIWWEEKFGPAPDLIREGMAART